ncbi:MAG: LuxR C-terminal-related transcriptional regulator [Bacillota bacterium]|nr:LuxR C-terminal-related transcriptional regulator [Bacillota bacterium]
MTAYKCSTEELESSYDRCDLLKVPPELQKPQIILPDVALAHCLAENALLLTLVERVMVTHHCAEFVYIVCNPELVTLKVFASPPVLTSMEEAGIRPGTVFEEKSCGTNALALARAHDRIIAVQGDQHYCALFKEWWCVAGPIKNPSGATLAYLDISIHVEKELSSAVTLLKTLLSLIVKELLLSDRSYGNPVLGGTSYYIPATIQSKLTTREQEILQLLLSGLTNPEIAGKLHLAASTVKTHRKHIYEKLGVKNLPEIYHLLTTHSSYRQNPPNG